MAAPKGQAVTVAARTPTVSGSNLILVHIAPGNLLQYSSCCSPSF